MVELETELDWYYGAYAASVGIRGQSIEVQGGGVFDADASARMHAGFRETAHRAAVERGRVVWRALEAMGPDGTRALQVIFEPRCYCFSSEAAAIGLANAFRRRYGSLLGLAVRRCGLSFLEARYFCGDSFRAERQYTERESQFWLAKYRAAREEVLRAWWE